MTDRIINPDILLNAYASGYFPMAERSGDIYWHCPDPRAIIPLDSVKMPKSMRQTLKKNPFSFSVNKEYEYVINACADRDETWISDEIKSSYIYLNQLGFSHSVEVWQNDEIVGGLYGVSLGAAFFGESMFSIVPNAAKAAFYFLVWILMEKGFILLDSQYMNDFTQSLGAINIPKTLYLGILENALEMPIKFS